MERRRRGRLRHQEEALAVRLAELKTDLSACKDSRTAAKLASSLGRIKSPEEYARDRQKVLQSLLQVERGRSLRVHCEVMKEENEMCSKQTYTPQNLPSILHQFHVDRVGELVLLKHLLLVRWARFAGDNSKCAEKLYGHFQKKIEYLMFEYNDSLHRARRLAAAASHDATTSKKTTPTVTINSDDVMIYLRWLVTHQRNTRTLASFITSVGWLPAVYCASVEKAASSLPPSERKMKPAAATLSSKWLTAQRDRTPSTPHTSTSHTLTTGHTHLRSFTSRHDNNSLSGVDHVTNSDITSHRSITMASSIGGGGGMANIPVGVVSNALPLHSTRADDLQDSMQQLMLAYGIRGSPSAMSPSDELQIFYEVSCKFHSLLPTQVPRPSPYDSGHAHSSDRGRGKVGGVFTKPANWAEFRELTPEPDPTQIICYSKIRDCTKDIDPLLSLSSLTSHLHTPQRALTALRQHAVTVKHPSLLPPLSSSSHLTSPSSLNLVWKSLYLGLDNRNPMDSEGSNSVEMDTMETGSHDDGESPAVDPIMSVRESTQVTSNEKGRGISAKATSVPKDTYLSFLLLRHLHTRDQRTACLSVLNYFRSVERSLTINHRGLSMESGQEMPTAGGGGLANHRHLHNTPADYMLSEVNFMQLTEVENHDDFYTFHSSPETGTGLVSVWDPLGVPVIYDTAQQDLQNLETELLTVATYYITRGRGLEATDKDKSTAAYGRRNVDRMAVLHDLWASEARYQDNKMKLVNCYLEIYHNTSRRGERERLAKVILTLMKSRPRYDPDSAYFTATFDLESRILEAHRALVRCVVEVVSEEDRGQRERLWQDKSQTAGENVFGFGLSPPPSHPVSLTGHTLLLPPSSLLDTLPSLSLLSSLPHSLHLALSQLSRPRLATPTQLLPLHLKLLEVALEEWEEHRHIDSAFTHDVTQNVFYGGCVDDANSVCEVGERWMREREKEGGGEGADKKSLHLSALCDVLNLVSLRHHLLLSAAESNLLTRHYKQLLVSLGHDECHAHLRCVTFDPNTTKAQTDSPLELFMSKVKESNLSTILDRYVPGQLGLAVGELDDQHLTTFSFRSQESILELLKSPTGLRKLQTALKTQVAHKWCLAISSLMNSATLRALEGGHGGPNIGGKLSGPPSSGGMITTASDMGKALSVKKALQKAFVSVQLEKVAVRDHMLSGLASRFHSTGKTRNGLETAKCCGVEEFCGNLVAVMSQYSLRHQILQLYQSLTSLLNLFPATRDGYFTVGKISTAPKPVPPHIKDPRSALSRPPLLLSEDGSRIRNLWYIPHTTEVLTMFSEGVVEDRVTRLKTVLSLVAPLVTILHYHVAYVRLGSCAGGGRREGGGKERGFRGDWGGTEGIGNVVQRLQNEVAELADPSDPHQVSEYLQDKCSVLYYQHTLTLQHYLTRTFLLHGNHSGVEILRFTSIPTLTRLSLSPSLHPTYFPLPMPTHPSNQSDDVQELPWQHFLSRCGSAPSLPDLLPWELGDVVMSGLAALSSDERVTANGEMLGLSLLLEEEVGTGQTGLSSPPEGQQSDRATPPSPAATRVKLIKEFLVLSLQLERLRWAWCQELLGVAYSLPTQSQAQQTEHTFRERIVGVARRQVAKQQMMLDQTKLSLEGDILDESMSHSNTFLTEGGMSGGGANSESLSPELLDNISERQLRRAQVVILLEELELGMIRETVNAVSQFHHLMMLELNRDTTTLPLDLWKMSPSMKEPAGVPRPHIVDSFLSRFHSSSTDCGPAYTISKNELKECVNQLSSDVLHRERETFQVYSGHYEGLVRSLYSQLYQRDRQLDMWRERAESVGRDNHTLALVTAGELTHSCLLELTALRVRIRELENQLQTQESELRKKLQDQYLTLTHSLLSSCSAITSRYSDYRSSLFSDVLRCVVEVRGGVAEGVARAKEAHSGSTQLGVAMTTKLRGEEECKVQSENAKLNNLLLKQRALHHLGRSVGECVREREVGRWRGKWEGVRRGGLEEKMVAQVEIRSLRAQVNSLQKRLGEAEKEKESAVLELIQKKDPSSSSATAANSTHNKTQLQVTHKSRDATSKMKRLAGELEEKEKEIGELESAWEKQHEQEEKGHKQLSQKLHVAKQQLEHERQLKREAFHQVDDLLTQVHDLEGQPHSSLRALHSRRHSGTTPHTLTSSSRHTLTGLRPHTSSSSRSHTHHTPSSAPHSRPGSQTRRQRPKSQQSTSSRGTATTSSNMHTRGQTIDLSQDILALKLI